MLVDFEFKAGLVFGIEADSIYLSPHEDKLFDFETEPNQVIYLHLGILTICFIW
jgi:hypothetical protein